MTIIMLAAELLWFLPLFLRQGKLNAAPKKYTVFAILAGLFFGIIVGVLGTAAFGMLMKTVAPAYEDTWGYKFFYNLFAAGVAEEFAKFAVAIIFIKLAKPVRKIDYIFIMGGAALGFALTENLMNNITGSGGIINALFPMHIMWQFFMGAHYYEAVQAKLAGDKLRRRKELLLAFGVPILMHGVYDFMIDVNQYVIGRLQELDAADALYTSERAALIALFIVVFAWMAGVLAFVIVSEVRTAKLVKESRIAEPAADGQNI